MSNEQDLSFDEAWELAADELSGEESSSSAQNTDTSSEANNQNTEEANVTATEQDTTSTTQSTENENTSGATNDLTLEEAVAQARLWEQRFKSFEGRVQAEMERRRTEELERQKQFVDALSMSAPNKPAATREDVVKSDKFEELSKDFPEIAEAVEEYLSKKLSKTEELVKKVVEEKVTPLAEDFSRQRVSSHLERILAKHPDALELRRSGALDAWIDTLPIYAQHGARYVVAGGSVDEVTALLDQYKDYTNSTNTNNQNTDKPTDSGTRSASQGMVEAIKAGLAVRSGKSADPKTDVKKSNKDDFDAGWEDAIRKLGV